MGEEELADTISFLLNNLTADNLTEQVRIYRFLLIPFWKLGKNLDKSVYYLFVMLFMSFMDEIILFWLISGENFEEFGGKFRRIHWKMAGVVSDPSSHLRRVQSHSSLRPTLEQHSIDSIPHVSDPLDHQLLPATDRWRGDLSEPKSSGSLAQFGFIPWPFDLWKGHWVANESDGHGEDVVGRGRGGRGEVGASDPLHRQGFEGMQVQHCKNFVFLVFLD